MVQGQPPGSEQPVSPACDFPDSTSTHTFAETVGKVNKTIDSATSAKSNIDAVLKSIAPISDRVKGRIIDYSHEIEEILISLRDDLFDTIKKKVYGIREPKDTMQAKNAAKAFVGETTVSKKRQDDSVAIAKAALNADGISMLSQKMNSLGAQVRDIEMDSSSLNEKVNTLPALVDDTLTYESKGVYDRIAKILVDVRGLLSNREYVPQAGGRTRGLKRKSKARTHRKNRR
jgi:hypothetical protein